MTTKPRRRGRPPKSKGSATKERILDAALEVFSERGFDGATVRQIAAKVGVSDPALYSHFKGKREIFDALMREAGPDLLSSINEETLAAPAASALPQIFGAVVQAWTAPRARAFTSLMLRMGPEGIGEALKEVSARLHPVFAAWQARGEIRSNIPVDVAIWQVIGPLSGLRLAYLHGNAGDSDIALATSLATTHLEQISISLANGDGTP